jgi:hypothetical protein
MPTIRGGTPATASCLCEAREDQRIVATQTDYAQRVAWRPVDIWRSQQKFGDSDAKLHREMSRSDGGACCSLLIVITGTELEVINHRRMGSG